MRNLTNIFATLIVAAVFAGCSKVEEPPAPEPVTKESPAKPAPTAPTPPRADPQPTRTLPFRQPALTGEVDEAQAVATFENAYRTNPDFTERVEAIYNLSDVGTPGAIAALGRLFHLERDPELKSEILDSLFDIDGLDEAKAALFAAGASADQPKEVRLSAIDGLGDIKASLALPILRTLANDRDEEIREAAQDAIELLQDDPPGSVR